jgi:hypothetical protein
MGISIRTVEALAAGEAIWDDKVKGFGCRKQLKGCSYVLKYRVNGRQQYLTLGQHGPLTPDTAGAFKITIETKKPSVLQGTEGKVRALAQRPSQALFIPKLSIR